MISRWMQSPVKSPTRPISIDAAGFTPLKGVTESGVRLRAELPIVPRLRTDTARLWQNAPTAFTVEHPELETAWPKLAASKSTSQRLRQIAVGRTLARLGLPPLPADDAAFDPASFLAQYARLSALSSHPGLPAVPRAPAEEPARVAQPLPETPARAKSTTESAPANRLPPYVLAAVEAVRDAMTLLESDERQDLLSTSAPLARAVLSDIMAMSSK